MTEFAGQHILVIGAGVTGRSVVSALVKRGAEVTVTVTDDNTGPLAKLADQFPGVRTATGLTELPSGIDLVVTSPGLRPENPLAHSAQEAGVEVISEVELAWRLDDGRSTWLAVTGTNGKTTTVGMLASILQAAGHEVIACGNIGLPVIDAVDADREPNSRRILAVELSSFQLYWSSTLAVRAAAILNVTEDHLDWHGTIEEYAKAKATIYRGDGVAVYNADDPIVAKLAVDRPHAVPFGAGAPEPGGFGIVDGHLVDRVFACREMPQPIADVADVRPPGPHNVANALAAAALAMSIGVPAQAVREGLAAFTPGDHRSVLVAERDGVKYINDSKATNPDAARASLLAQPKAVWLAGGLLKGANVDDLVLQTREHLAAAVLFGTDRAVIADALARHAPEVPVYQVQPGEHGVMDTAVRTAHQLAQPGDSVLLAPSAASMDQFTDYAHRGRAFAEAVRTVLEGADQEA
ncbi:UDP-N-acetylmuramoyl-L-alanine--D-glutamate ligase [Pseudonocardiaceae bacterium YIM PH 21723]|nr:UDP-N-acetylmuramoyl-L-alanine--D-glutamate ligase [Pseudonocardiaceae bacterium YIM PH 21723]